MTLEEGSRLDEFAALRSIVEGTAGETGEDFFGALVDNLSEAMGTMGAWVAIYDEPARALRAIAMTMRKKRLDGFIYPVEGTPCEMALE
jgi:hypothetical protein